MTITDKLHKILPDSIHTVDDDGQLRVLGVPVSLDLPHTEDDPTVHDNAAEGGKSIDAGSGANGTAKSTRSQVFSRTFEPENPNLLVPRQFGIGWDLNFGALAVKAGWIRPDDSLPDLAEHTPDPVVKALRFAPVVGAALVVAAALNAARYDRLPRQWTFTGRPKRWGGRLATLVPPLILSTGGALAAARSKDTETLAPTAARILGLQTVALTQLIAGSRAAKANATTSYSTANSLLGLGRGTARGAAAARQPLAALSALVVPAVATAVLVGTVRASLGNIQHTLGGKVKHEQQTASGYSDDTARSAGADGMH